MRRYAAILIIPFIFVMACSKSERGFMRSYPLDDLKGVLAGSNVAIDKEITSDGGGSLRIEASDAITVPLYEVRDLQIENARLLYQAKVRTEGVIGQVYLEMMVHLPERGEFLSRGQQTLVTGTTDWTTQEIPFFFQRGERPDYIKLNLVINGHGTAWIDDIKLSLGPLG